MWGIDISKWQGDLDIKDVAPEFCLIKAGGSDDGLYIDSQFLDNYIKCKNLGIPCGLYWYTSAVSVTNLRTEIDYLLGNINGLQFELPIYLDLEEMPLYNKAGQLAAEWLNVLPNYGYFPGIYSSYSWFEDALKTVKKSMLKEQIWLALWMSGTDPDYDCGIWQNGHIQHNGMEIDHDYMFSDFSFIKEKGLNGFMNKDYFKDVTADMSSYKAIMWAASKEYVKGYKDGTFRPDEPLTRAQLCVILWRMAGRPEP